MNRKYKSVVLHYLPPFNLGRGPGSDPSGLCGTHHLISSWFTLGQQIRENTLLFHKIPFTSPSVCDMVELVEFMNQLLSILFNFIMLYSAFHGRKAHEPLPRPEKSNHS